MAPGAPVAAGFRDYTASAFQARVERTYEAMHRQQTVAFARGMAEQYGQLNRARTSVWDMSRFLDEVVDESDPDNDLPQTVHAYQTAESILTRYFASREALSSLVDTSVAQLFAPREWDALPAAARKLYTGKTLAGLFPHLADWSWFPLVGLIHDLGKVMAHPKFGGLPQWAVVGDTFVAGCAFDKGNVFADRGWWSSHNPDAQDLAINSTLGLYREHCGFEAVTHSWGHDEYLALVIRGFQADVASGAAEAPRKAFPDEAVYMIRYHSFYPWHSPRGEERCYTELASADDWRRLPLLKALQKSDLYSKSPTLPPMAELEAFYSKLAEDYFPGTLRW